MTLISTLFCFSLLKKQQIKLASYVPFGKHIGRNKTVNLFLYRLVNKFIYTTDEFVLTLDQHRCSAVKQAN
tara:strand:- start:597 stop:809 length:213 start_codon:yes stop_codon:yes gene_type:complete